MATDLGKVNVTPKGTWSSGSTYEFLDIVAKDGSSYLAIQDVPANTAVSNTTYWLQIAAKGDKGDTGEISGASASISGTYGTPSVTVTPGGTSTDRTFAFAFSNLVGNGIASVSCEKTATVGAVDTYTLTITEDDGTENEFALTVTNGSVTSVNGRTGAVTGLAEEDGYYDEMSVGSAEQLISSTYEEDSVPYVFRTSGGSIDIGDREFDEIHGGTVAFNQLAHELNSTNWATGSTQGSASFSDGVATITVLSGVTGSASFTERSGVRKRAIKGHVYLGKASVYASRNTHVRYMYSPFAEGTNIVAVGANTWVDYTSIVKIVGDEESFNSNFYYNTSNELAENDTVQFKSINIIDLTQMFGSSIADYIYTVEQGTAGAGVALAKQWGNLNKPYYPYNAGGLISVTGLSAHKMTGFNQWDEEWEQGHIDCATGTNAYNTSRIRSKNYIPVVGGMQYYLNVPFEGTEVTYVVRCFYDANKNFISGANSRTRTITVPQEACYLRFSTDSAYGGTYKNNICVSLYWDGERAGEYEEYTEHSYPLDSSLTLRGIPKLDADNKLYYDGDVYSSDGTVERRIIERTLTSTHVVSVSNSYENIVYAKVSIAGGAVSSLTKEGMSSKYGMSITVYPFDDASNIGKMGKDAITNQWWFGFPVGTTLEQAKNALVGTSLIEFLAEPTTESAEPYAPVQWVDDWGTEEYVIAEQSGVALPVGHKTRYSANLKAKLEMAPDSPSGNGDYIVRQSGGQNTYVPLVIPNELPSNPSEDGTYVLKATVASGTTTLSWEVQS